MENSTKGLASKPSFHPLLIVGITAVVYAMAIGNGFTNYDDLDYIHNNPYLKDKSIAGILGIFTHFHAANYHPLTTLSNFLEYSIWGTNPVPYLLGNVLLHLLNTWLTYQVALQLSRSHITAAVVSLMFGLHPMHVESVAWIAERKDVLYTAFYLAALAKYLHYLDSGKKTVTYLQVAVLALAAMLSKSAAVTLPILLLVVDWYKTRPLKESIVEKLPLFALSLLFGILAIRSQTAGNAISNIDATYGLVDRVVILVATIATYLLHCIVPIGLSAVHPFPKLIDGHLPWMFYLSIPGLAGLIWLLAKQKKLQRELVFGFLFFLVTISVMLQIIAVGSSYYAERYTYVSYIGLFYILGQLASLAATSKQWTFIKWVIIGTAISFSVLTWQRIGIWADAKTLFSDVIEKYPDHYFAYWMRGTEEKTRGNLPAALADFSEGIRHNPTFEDLYYNRGHVRSELGDVTAAIQDFDMAIALQPTMAVAHNDRAWILFQTGDTAAAMAGFDKALNLDPNLSEAYNNRGWAKAQSGQMAAAIQDFDKAIALKPTYTAPYANRAMLKLKNKDLAGAMADYNQVLQITPDDATMYYNRGQVYFSMGQRAAACTDWQKSASMGYTIAEQILKQYCK